MIKFIFVFASLLAIGGCGGSGNGGGSNNAESNIVTNGGFETVHRSPYNMVGPSHPYGFPSAPRYWFSNTGKAGASFETELVPSTAPGGSGMMLRYKTDQGQDASFNGSAIGQYVPTTSNTRFECDIFVVQGTVMLGQVLTGGPFNSQTTYTPNGQWRHIVLDCASATETVAFQNVGAVASTLEIYVDNVRLIVP